MKVELTIYVPTTLRTRLRVHAAETGQPISHFCELVLARALDRLHSNRTKRKGRKPKP